MNRWMWPVAVVVALAAGFGLGRWSSGSYRVWMEGGGFVRVDQSNGRVWIYPQSGSGWQLLPEGDPVEPRG